MSCVIEGCKSHTGRKENMEEPVTFHRFPKDVELRNKWIWFVNRRNWCWKNHSRICSKHFTPDNFLPNENIKWRRLKARAIPTLHLTDTDTLVSAPVPMDVCDAEHIKASSTNILSESGINVEIDVPSISTMETTTSMLEVSDMKSTVESSAHSNKNVEKETVFSTTLGYNTSASNQPEPKISRWQHELDRVKKVSQRRNTLTKPFSSKKKTCNTSACSTCDQHERTILRLQRELERAREVSQRRLRKINTLTKRLSRLGKKTDDLYTILINRLKQENVETEYITLLDNINQNDIIRRFLQKQGGETLTREYSQEIKKFAVTLHYLSPKAYTFIREQFQDVLPHPKTITAWYKGVDCNPGFTSESFDSIKARVQQDPDKSLFCALAIDEMAIRKLIEWDSHNQNYYGFVNLGCEFDSDSVPIATQALTFMVTCLNDTWKIPVGYFLTTHLGCDVAEGSTSFQCGESDSEICLWPDPCHNIKLVRNAFADKKILIDSDNNIISWNYIEKLVKLQEDEGLHLGNKLRRSHINFIKQKMKVRLATQLFSNSVADALQYCKEKSIPGFEDCDATIKFIRVFNNLFDIFNSRNLRAKGWKRALATFNFEETKLFFETADSYIRHLKMDDGTYLIDSNRRTGFNGFLVCMKSLLKIFENTVVTNKLQYLCTYKMSQDQIELFFGAIRSKCGFNNNPSARTFQAAYKRLLVHAQFKDGSTGNCIPLERISILNYKPKNSVDAINQSSGNVCLLRDAENSEAASMSQFHVVEDHDYVPSPILLSEYSKDIVHYMAGYVVRKLQTSLKCENCIESLCDNENNLERVTLINIKDRGGLLVPSKDVFKICEATERIIRQQKSTVSEELLGRRKHVMTIINKVCGTFIESRLFDNLTVHSNEQDFENNHRMLLIKAVCKIYLTARIHHIIKQACVPHDKIRSFLTKTILFKGQ